MFNYSGKNGEKNRIRLQKSNLHFISILMIACPAGLREMFWRFANAGWLAR